MFDTYENKVWLNGVITQDGILQRNCTSIVPLDRNNNIYTNTNGNADVVFFDKDGKYISTLNFYNTNPVLKENFPENAELVAFTYFRDSIITDKFFASAKNNYNLKLCQSTILKKKGTRPVVNINLNDSEEEIFLKLASAYITQDCDVYFETGEYRFNKIFELMNIKYDFRTAIELPIGGNCRYFFNHSTLISECDIDKAANNYICKINKFLQMIEEENGLIDIETLLGKSIDNLIVSPVQEYPDMFKGVTIGNGKIRIGLPGINKDIVLDANDIETFKQSLVK